MKKRISLVILVLICALALSACGCKHEIWNEADCVTPKTCAKCGEIEGAPLGHSWLAATCDTARTCEVCGETEGEALGHSWLAATCDTAKTCEVCGETEGEALDHSWTEASCAAPKTCAGCGLTEGEALEHTWAEATTEAPITCTGCGATEGERIITDERFTTAATKDLHGNWVCSVELDAETFGDLAGLDDVDFSVTFLVYLELSNDGDFHMTMDLADENALKASLKDYLVKMLYAELADAGMDKDAADAAMQQAYGMSIEEYAASAVAEMDFKDTLGDISYNGVYYVKDGTFYSSSSWADAMEEIPYTLEGDTFTLKGDLAELGMDSLVFTRVSE